MRVTICGPNLEDQSRGSFHVHSADCGDLQRHAKREPEYLNGWTIEVDTRDEVTRNVYPPEDFQYDPTNGADSESIVGPYVYFFPCTEGLEAYLEN